jgi:segregation and condensation protein B
MERDLVRIEGRSAELGRPYLYSTTKRFLQIFGLINLEALPRRAELKASPLPDVPPASVPSANEPQAPEPSPVAAVRGLPEEIDA